MKTLLYMRVIYFICFLNLLSFTNAQVGIGTDTPNSSAILELKSENLGFLPPRVKLKSNTDTTTIPDPNIGLMVYNLIPESNETGLQYNGMVVWNGEEWRTLSNLYLGDGNIQEFNCANAKLYPSTYNAGELYNGVLDVPYIGGNGGLYSSVIIGPSNGLTASIEEGNLLTGNGSLQYKISGTPISGSPNTTTFSITLNGKTCDAIIGAGTSVDQGGIIFHKSPDVLATIGSGDRYTGNVQTSWLSYYDENLPIIGGKLRLDAYFYASSDTNGSSVSWNPRIVNITDEPVKFWFASFSSQENFDGSNVVIPSKTITNGNENIYWFGLDNGVYLDRGNNYIIPLAPGVTPVNHNTSGSNRNEMITVDLSLDEKWYRIYYFPYVDNMNNTATNSEPYAQRKFYISIQRLY